MIDPLNPETISSLKEYDEPGHVDFLREIITTYLEDTTQRFFAV